MSKIQQNAQKRKRQRITNFISMVICITHKYKQQCDQKFADHETIIAELRQVPATKRTLTDLQRQGRLTSLQLELKDQREKLARIADYWHFGILNQVAVNHTITDFSVAQMMRDLFEFGCEYNLTNMLHEIGEAERNELNY
jgi:hypothetical protein